MRFTTALLLMLGLCLPTSLLGANATAKSVPDKVLVENTVVQYPLFKMLVEDQKEFKKNWLAELGRLKLTKPDKDGQVLAVEAGVNLAMDVANLYLAKADDDAAIMYLAVYTDLLSLTAKDETLCALFLDDEKDKDEKAKQQKINVFEDKYFDVLLPKMVEAMTALVISGRAGRDGEAKIVTEEQRKAILLEALALMVEKRGVGALGRIPQMTDASTPKAERCETMAWLFAAISDLPREKRALLGRTILSE